MADKTALADVRARIWDHCQELQTIKLHIDGQMRQLTATYRALDDILAPTAFHVDRDRLRELIANEEDLPVEVGPLAAIEAEFLRSDYGTCGIEIQVVLDEGEDMPDFKTDTTLTIRGDVNNE